MSEEEKELERLAQEELQREATRSKVRADTMGPMGWQSCPLGPTNKRFLRNMLLGTLEPRSKKARKTDGDIKEKESRKNLEKGKERGQSSKSSYKSSEAEDEQEKNHHKTAEKKKHNDRVISYSKKSKHSSDVYQTQVKKTHKKDHLHEIDRKDKLPKHDLSQKQDYRTKSRDQKND